MDTTVRFEVDDTAAQRMFARLLAMGTDQSGPMAEASDILEQRIRQTFRDEADPWGNPWPAHSAATLAGRERRDNSRTSLLFDTGAMYTTIRRQSGADEASVSIGGPGTWPVVHQFGNPDNRAWGGIAAPIPARPMFPIRESGPDLPRDLADQIRGPFEKAMEAAANE